MCTHRILLGRDVRRSVSRIIHALQLPTMLKIRRACAMLGVVLITSCGTRESADTPDHGRPPNRRSTTSVRAQGEALPLETTIARDLTARLGVPVTVRCEPFAV